MKKQQQALFTSAISQLFCWNKASSSYSSFCSAMAGTATNSSRVVVLKKNWMMSDHWNSVRCFSTSGWMNGRPRKKDVAVEQESSEVPKTVAAESSSTTTMDTSGNTENTSTQKTTRGRKSKTTITDAEQVIDKTFSQEKQQEILVQSMDKLTKKYEKLEKAVAAQQELLGMMSTTLHVIGEQQVQNRVLQLLKTYKIIPLNTPQNANPFVRINSRDKLETLVTGFINSQHLPTAIQSIKKAIPHQLFVSGLDGSIQSYLDIMNPNWVHSQSGGSLQHLVSGDVCMVGTLENVTHALHRALRYPIMVRRFTSKVNNLLFQHAEQRLSITQGMEKVTLFVVVGTPKSYFDETIPARFFNRTFTERDFDDLETYILDSFEGTVVIPDDSELENLIIKSDPIKDPLGVWKLLLSIEYNNERVLAKKAPGEKREVDPEVVTKVLLLALLKLTRIHNFDLFLGSVVNPLN